jgi:multidrug efflux system outer membrane protein
MMSFGEASRIFGLFGLSILLDACALQAPYRSAAPHVPVQWSNTQSDLAGKPPVLAADESWWTQLHDPAIDALISASLADNPTLEQALARFDQARAELGIAAAQRIPTTTVMAVANRTRTENNVGVGSGFGLLANTVQAGPNFSWELDLWGRVKQSNIEAKMRLAARDADAQSARLSVASQVASGVLNLRACSYSLKVRDNDIASREVELDLIRQRVAAGNAAAVDEASAISNLATARTTRLSQFEQCSHYTNALVALSGRDIDTVRDLVGEPLPFASGMPALPPMQLALPATVLATHPSVVAAEREVGAAWAHIGVAKASRLPKIELDAMLSGQWLSALGTTYTLMEWSLGPALNGTLFDGGAGSAKVDAARARYREAVANLNAKLRATVQNVEDALARQASANARLVSSQLAQDAARTALRANEARWRAGAISRFELEASRRQFEAAEESVVVATRDRCQAWVSLIQATGYGPSLSFDERDIPSKLPQS